MVASRQTYKKCRVHKGLSWEHAVEYVEVEKMLAPELASIPEAVRANMLGHTVIDVLINEAVTGMSRERAEVMVSTINIIEVQC